MKFKNFKQFLARPDIDNILEELGKLLYGKEFKDAINDEHYFIIHAETIILEVFENGNIELSGGNSELNILTLIHFLKKHDVTIEHTDRDMENCRFCRAKYIKEIEMEERMAEDFEDPNKESIGTIIDWVVNNGYIDSFFECRCGRKGSMMTSMILALYQKYLEQL